MKKQWKRLLVAALSSSSVFAVTWYWYQSTGNSNSSYGNEKPLAYVGKVVEDIQRRPASRLLWQLVNTGEPLYNGEAIRTSEKGEVRIQFVDSDRYLDLEPESLIVIKRSQGEIALDLMEGSLFVNAKAGGDSKDAPGLVLNSANGKVDLSQASASLSKGKGNSVDVQVLEGKASIKGSDGKSKDLTSATTEIKILAPLPQKPIAMDAEAPQPVQFQWSGFPANTQVSLWVGSSRKELKEVAKSDLNQSQLSANLPFGRHYWKLVGTTPDGKNVAESTIYKSEVLARYAPTVVFPLSDAEIPATATPFDVTFKWQKGDDTRQTTLEVWKDAALKQKLTSKSFASDEAFTLPALDAGTYYYRMGAYFTDSDKPILGKVQKFTVKPAEQVKVQAEIIPVQVNFTMPEAQYSQYFVQNPKVGLSWKTDKNEHVNSYRVKLLEENADPSSATSLEVKDLNVQAPVTKPGRYIASVEALNKDGQVLGTTTSQPLTLAVLPLLKSPQLLPAEGNLQAASDGKTQLEWNPVEGAKEYWLVIRKQGKELKRSKYTNTTTSLKNLLPGEYDLELTAMDTHGRSSEVGPIRKLLVPDKSGLKAPTLKKIKVN
ncbi:FecR domain-containing protein [Bdellovibrio reynosensis]|uniref:FecR domain-containing protein n=1 Tax=Bdellovibrio reynosensis TaxID=2835041 RepID=A0ABY4CG20_9BACT|nr:FecR domain-containing protein [Bdellovibrio reynosensis]UOF02741.1 FecR domain-containing protein [Bdellovibrio reynosensis]